MRAAAVYLPLNPAYTLNELDYFIGDAEPSLIVCDPSKADGITALAVPIRDSSGRVVAAVNTSGYSPRLKPEDLLEQRMAEMQIAAARISGLLMRFPALLHSLVPH